MSITAVGLTTRLLPAGSATANVGNVITRTNTFHVLNANATNYAYVGVFNNYADALAMDYPAPGADGGGIPLAPNESMTITGNFGPSAIGTSNTVYVSAITATGAYSSTVFFTPISTIGE